MSSPWEQVIARPDPHGHLVQLYDEAHEGPLIGNVSRYLREGLENGGGALVIATPGHTAAFRQELDESGIPIHSAVRSGRLKFLDCQETLNKFMIDGQPEWHRFQAIAGAAIYQVRSAEPTSLRAYGEMVNVLWKARQYAAAIRLEQFWNKLLSRSSFSLYCAYSIDIFGTNVQVSALEGVLCTHTHMVPGEADGKLEEAMNRAMEQVLGPEAGHLRAIIKANHRPSWALMPAGESIALWLRKNLPKKSEEILELARQYYEAPSDQSLCHQSLCPEPVAAG